MQQLVESTFQDLHGRYPVLTRGHIRTMLAEPVFLIITSRDPKVPVIGNRTARVRIAMSNEIMERIVGNYNTENCRVVCSSKMMDN